MSAKTRFVVNAFDKIVFCGDSLVAGGVSGGGGISVSWDVPLQTLLNNQFTPSVNCRCVDKGRPTLYSVQGFVATQMDYWAGHSVALCTGVGANLVFVSWGRNDASGNAVAPATTVANLITGCQNVWAVEPNIRFVMIPSTIENGEQRPDGANADDSFMTAMDTALMAGADTLQTFSDANGKGGITAISLRSWCFATELPLRNPTNGAALHTITVDNLHLNRTGAQDFAAQLMTFADLSLAP